MIYALNTKNDEHEMIVRSLQQQHDKEKTQLLEQTKVKIEELRSKLGKLASPICGGLLHVFPGISYTVKPYFMSVMHMYCILFGHHWH